MIPKIKSYPLVGSLPLLQNDPLNTFYQWFQEHGDTYHFKILNKNVYMICNPHDVEKVLKTKREHMRRGGSYAQGYARFGEGIVFGDGENWHVQRKICAAVFRKRSMELIYHELSKRFDEIFNQHLDEKDLNNFDSESMAMPLALNLFLYGIFGEGVTRDLCQNIKAEVDKLKRSYEKDAANIFQRIHAHYFYTSYKKNIDQKTQAIDALLSDFLSTISKNSPESIPIIASFKKEFVETCGREASNRDITEFMRALILAGYESTGRSLTFYWHHLTNNPDCYQKVLDETQNFLKIDNPTYQDLTQLDYTLRSWHEALRLSPPIAVFGREPLTPIKLSDVTVRPGEWIWLSPFIVGRHPQHWGEDITRFNPDRFLPEAVEKRAKCAWFPFSYYGFGCLGKALSDMEAMLIITKTLQKYHVELLAPKELQHTLELTTAVKQAIKLKMIPREAGE